MIEFPRLHAKHINMFCFLLTFLVFNGFFTHVKGALIEDANNLYSDLFANYNKQIRPVYNQSDNVIVRVHLSLISLKDFDEVSGTLKIVVVFTIVWHDTSLMWDPSSYGGMTELHVQQSQIWLPKLYNIKVSDSFHSIGDSNTLVRIENNGLVEWVPGGLLGVKCNPDVSFFPFDTQMCSVVIAAWGYSENHVYVMPIKDNIGMYFYEKNGEWAVDNTASESFTIEDFRVVAYNITISRLPTFHVVNTLLPIFILSFMNPLVFLLPCESGERVGFSLTVLLSFTVFVTIVNSVLPANSDHMSQLSYFVFCALVFSGIIASINIALLRMYYRDENAPVPQYLKRLLQLVTCKLCRCKSNKTGSEIMDRNSEKEVNPGCNDDQKALQHDKFKALESATDITWKDVVRILDLFFACLFYISLSVASAIAMITISLGGK